MVKKGDRARFQGVGEAFVGVITSYHFCDMPDPKYSHWRATMRCDAGQRGIDGKIVSEVEANVTSFEPTKEMSCDQFMLENPEVAKAFRGGYNGL